jgi:hypothetical protein
LDAEDDDEEEDDLWDGPAWRWPPFELPPLHLPTFTLPAFHLPALRLPSLPRPPLDAMPRWTLPAGAAVVVAAGLGGWLLLRPRAEQVKPLPVQPVEQPAPAPAAPVQPSLPLTAAEPSDAQLQLLLEAWLQAKAALLAGQPPGQPLDQIARPVPVQRLQEQLRANEQAGAVETVTARVTSLRTTERSPQRIAVEATLTYSDRRSSSDGTLLSQTPSSNLRNIYVFARDGQQWRLAAFRPSP